MFVVTINSIDASCHTANADATLQKARFEAAGASSVAIVEKDTFSPPEVSMPS